MRKIVVPVSYGANSATAARYAASIGLVTGSEIRLVYVLQSPSVFTHHPIPDFLFGEMRDKGFTLLNNLRNELSGLTGGKVRVTIDMEIGQVDQRLKTYCSKHRPFLVVMGAPESSHGQDYGAVHAVEAMKHLPHPLLVVPHDASFHGAPKVLIACDREDIFSGLSPIIPFLKELHELLGTRFQIVHIVADGESFEETRREYDGWKKELEALQPGLQLVRQSKVEEGINDYLENHAADWLLVLPKKHSLLEFHKSRAKDIVLHCHVPVLSLHE
jgi:nucleotide-binding universal stress UspA family protein